MGWNRAQVKIRLFHEIQLPRIIYFEILSIYLPSAQRFRQSGYVTACFNLVWAYSKTMFIVWIFILKLYDALYNLPFSSQMATFLKFLRISSPNKNVMNFRCCFSKLNEIHSHLEHIVIFGIHTSATLEFQIRKAIAHEWIEISYVHSLKSMHNCTHCDANLETLQQFIIDVILMKYLRWLLKCSKVLHKICSELMRDLCL